MRLHTYLTSQDYFLAAALSQDACMMPAGFARSDLLHTQLQAHSAFFPIKSVSAVGPSWCQALGTCKLVYQVIMTALTRHAHIVCLPLHIDDMQFVDQACFTTLFRSAHDSNTLLLVDRYLTGFN